MDYSGPNDKRNKNPVVEKLKSYLARCLQGGPIHPKGVFVPKGEAFGPGGEYEALGQAAKRFKGVADAGQRRELWESLKTDFEDDPAALDQLREVEAQAGPGPLIHHEDDPLPPEFGGPEPPETYPTLAEARDILGETEYAWSPYIMSGGLNAIAGDVGSGKTLFGMDLHRRQWHGLQWPDGSTIEKPRRRVVWVMADQRLGQLTEAARNMDVPDESIVLAAEKDKPTLPLTLDDPSHLDRLNRIVRDVEPWAVFVDTFTSAMGTREHHKPEVMNPITDSLIGIAQAYRVPVVLMCHTNAEGGIYGKALGRKCEHQISLVLSDRKDMASPRNIHCRRSRRMEDTRSFGVRYDKSAWSYCEPHEEVDDSVRRSPRGSKGENDAAEVALVLHEAGPDGAGLGEIAEALQSDGRSESAAEQAANRVLRKMRQEGSAVNRNRRWFSADSGCQVDGELPP